MTFSDETLMAYVDRELDAATAAAIEAAMVQDPDLAARVERQRKLRGAVYAAYEPVSKEPLPERLLEAARGAAATPPAPDRVSRDAARFARAATRRWTWFEWSAVAASIALGVAIGSAFLGDMRRGAPAGDIAADFVADQGQLLARGALARALSEQLASSQPSDAAVRVGLTFVSAAGNYCRTFTLERGAGSARLAGLACKGTGEWRVQLIAQGDRPSGTAGEYRTAAADLPQAVLRAVEERIQGGALDAQAERAARERNWTR